MSFTFRIPSILCCLEDFCVFVQISSSDQQIDESDGVDTHSISNLTLQSVDRLSIWTPLLREVRFIGPSLSRHD